jgi:hypothetical protein
LERQPRPFRKATSFQQSAINQNLDRSDEDQSTSEVSYPRVAESDRSVDYDIYGWGL